jgi:hypothetical protein
MDWHRRFTLGWVVDSVYSLTSTTCQPPPCWCACAVQAAYDCAFSTDGNSVAYVVRTAPLCTAVCITPVWLPSKRCAHNLRVEIHTDTSNVAFCALTTCAVFRVGMTEYRDAGRAPRHHWLWNIHTLQCCAATTPSAQWATLFEFISCICQCSESYTVHCVAMTECHMNCLLSQWVHLVSDWPSFTQPLVAPFAASLLQCECHVPA